MTVVLVACGGSKKSKNNKKDDNDADQSDISSPVKWFFLHKFQPF